MPLAGRSIVLLGLVALAAGCPASPRGVLDQAPREGGGLANVGEDPKAAASAVTTQTLGFPAAPIQRFSATVELGSLTLKTDPNATQVQAVVELELKASTTALAEQYLSEVTVEQHGADGAEPSIRVQVPARWRSDNFANRPGKLQVRMTITGPTLLAYTLDVGTGEIVVEGDTLGLMATAKAGGVQAPGTHAGRVKLDCTAGDCVGGIGNAEWVQASASKGSLTLYDHSTAPLTGNYTATVSNGSLEVQLPVVTTGQARLYVGEGNVHATLPIMSSVAFTLTGPEGALTLSGARETATIKTDTPDQIHGTLGQPLGDVTLNAVKGRAELMLVEESPQ